MDSSAPLYVEQNNEESLWLSIFTSLHLVKDTLRNLKTGQEAPWENDIHQNLAKSSEIPVISCNHHEELQALQTRNNFLESAKNAADTEISNLKQELAILLTDFTEMKNNLETQNIKLIKENEQNNNNNIKKNKSNNSNNDNNNNNNSDNININKNGKKNINKNGKKNINNNDNNKIERECECKDGDGARLLKAKEREIQRLREAVQTNAELVEMVKRLQKQFGSQKNVSAHKELPSNFYASSRFFSSSQNSNLNLLENEPKIELENTEIFVSLSRRSSLSRTGSFKYKDLTPKRLAELERRNSIQLPHLKSSYPTEQSARAWRHDSPEEFQNGDGDRTASKVEKKEGFLKQLSSLRKGKKNEKTEKNKENKIETSTMKTTEKPVAFVVDITPPEKKKAPKSKR